MTERARGIIIHRPIIYGNSAYPILPDERDSSTPPDHTHRWTVAIRSAANDRADAVAGADDLSYFIKRVTFRLHETYPSPNRNVDKPPFEVTETGWGEFDINIRVSFIQESAEKTVNFTHHLKLHPWVIPDVAANPTVDPALLAPPPPRSGPNGETIPPPMEPVHSWQYDEIVFTDPPNSFFEILMAHPPTPLPKVKRRPIPPNPAHLESLTPPYAKGMVPEFTQVLERDEGERQDSAKRQIVDATQEQRAILIQKELELAHLRKEFGVGR